MGDSRLYISGVGNERWVPASTEKHMLDITVFLVLLNVEHLAVEIVDFALAVVDGFRNILRTEQQELRVVLAHLRAISFDTVKAISEWRVRCRQLRQTLH